MNSGANYVYIMHEKTLRWVENKIHIVNKTQVLSLLITKLYQNQLAWAVYTLMLDKWFSDVYYGNLAPNNKISNLGLFLRLQGFFFRFKHGFKPNKENKRSHDFFFNHGNGILIS